MPSRRKIDECELDRAAHTAEVNRSEVLQGVVVAKRGVALLLAVLVIGVIPGGVMLVATPSAAALERVDAPECTNAHLTASYKGRDAAMSHVYGRIVLKNTSNEACWIDGYGGLSYVGDGEGTQIGAAADRIASEKPRTVVVPGGKVRSPVVERSFGAYPKRKCQPQAVDGFRVYLPDETRSQFVPHSTTGCANTEIAPTGTQGLPLS